MLKSQKLVTGTGAWERVNSGNPPEVIRFFCLCPPGLAIKLKKGLERRVPLFIDTIL